MRYVKYHALGNDYLVMSPQALPGEPEPAHIRRICHRHLGVGSDGILLGPLASASCDFAVRIFNPDGSEAEKSGNGLRIFARALRDAGLVKDSRFTVETRGGTVTCEVLRAGRSVTVEMGEVSFDSRRIPVLGAAREVLNETIEAGGELLTYCAATVGNPHCVVLSERPTAEQAQRLGPLLEVAERFPRRTNVQFLKVLDRANIQIEIWERGAGYTLASGSSSTAAAAVAHRLGLCESEITVHMPGGDIEIRFSDGLRATMTGPVTGVCEGTIMAEMFE